MIKAVIFDCFGVLIADALEAVVAEFRDSEPARAQEIADTVQLSSRGVVPIDESRIHVAKLLGMTPEAYVTLLRDGEVKNEALMAHIRELRETHKTALLSNVSEHGLESRFTPEELAETFDAVVASGAVGYAKPEAQIYEITADRLGVRLEECVFIDDREDYCMGARGVGMHTIRYESLPQLRAELDPLLVTA